MDWSHNERANQSVEVSQPQEHEGAIRRNILSSDKLIDSLPGISTCHELMKRCSIKFSDGKCYGVRPIKRITKEKREGKEIILKELGEYQWCTYKQAYERALTIGSGLVQLDLRPKDKIAIFEETCLEWILIAHACFSQNITLLSIYSNLGESGLEYALNIGKITHLVTSTRHIQTVKNIVSNVPSLVALILIDNKVEESGLDMYTLEEVENMGNDNPLECTPPLPQDTALVMFTSGSTGNPKGAVISHENLVSAIGGALISGLDKLFSPDEDIYLAFLPLAHILAFIVQFTALYIGVPIGFGSPKTLLDSQVTNCKGDISELKPTVFIAVPSVFNKIRSGIESKVKKSGWISREIFHQGLNLKISLGEHNFVSKILDKLIFKKLKSQFGGRIKFMMSGGAPLSKETKHFIQGCFGVPILEGYGLTETTGPSCISDLYEQDPSSVGPPCGSIEIKLVDVEEMGYSSKDQPCPRGEIYIRGPAVITGYLNDEENNKANFSDGWFITGDIGKWLPNGSLSIIDRKKSLIKGAHGEYIATENLESIYSGSNYVDNICVYLDSSNFFPIAFIQPNPQSIEHLSKKLHVGGTFEKKCKDKQIIGEVLKDIQDIGRKARLKNIEIIRNISLETEEWTVENRKLTAAFKIIRRNILAGKEKEIERMFKEIDQSP